VLQESIRIPLRNLKKELHTGILHVYIRGSNITHTHTHFDDIPLLWKGVFNVMILFRILRIMHLCWGTPSTKECCSMFKAIIHTMKQSCAMKVNLGQLCILSVQSRARGWIGSMHSYRTQHLLWQLINGIPLNEKSKVHRQRVHVLPAQSYNVLRCCRWVTNIQVCF
jgi:hypothetical protein